MLLQIATTEPAKGGPVATTSPTRIDDEVFESARHVGATMSRSASQQITHWARIGRELEAGASVSPRDIAKVLTGEGSYDKLSVEEQAVIRAEWSELIEARIDRLDLAQTFSSHGRSYVELDDAGAVIQRTP
jgi:hypothetical protein